MGGTVTGLKEALEGLPELRFEPHSLTFIPKGIDEFGEVIGDEDVVYDDDMTSPLPGLAIRPLGVVGEPGGGA